MRRREMPEPMAAHVQTAFLDLASYLNERNYTFVCPTPESQERVVRKRSNDPETRHGANLEDFFGWSLPAEEKTLSSLLPSELLKQMREASIITAEEDHLSKSNFRISDLYMPIIVIGERLNRLYYIHSAFPTTESDAVFFGPDTYFFLDFLTRESSYLPAERPRTVVDVCCGSGAGAIHLARRLPNSQVLGLDLNPKALSLGKINAKMADCYVSFAESDLFAAVKSQKDIDLIVSNPPYIASAGNDIPMYAAGGAQQGLDLPLRIVKEGIEALANRGLVMIYTGVPISYRKPGHDPFLEQLRKIEGAELVSYKIIHPDMFGEELSSPAYADTGRIQVIGAVLRKLD